MKKILYFAAMAALLLVSCNQDEPKINEPEKKTDAFTFKASIEDLATSGNAGSSSNVAKATINGSYGLDWYLDTKDDSNTDRIGIYFPTWGDKHQEFKLTSGSGTPNGEFSRVASGDYDPNDASVAFFPWQGTGSDKNNVYEGNVYFKLKDWYDGYTTSGKMLTPLVASISDAGNISFKHAGGAVQLTINNLVSGGYKAKMTVEGKQITGGFHVNPANAGTEALTLDAAEDVSKNHITLNSWKGSGAFSWIFPVPALSTPKLTFEIIDANGITVWSKSPKAQSSVGRAGLLVMPARDITPYEKFVQDDEEWTFHGTVSNSDWMDIPMMTDGNYCILSGFTFKDGDEFKIHNKKTNAWYPASNWEFNSTNAGAKDIIFNISTQEIRVVDYKFPYPAPSFTPSISIAIDGDMSDWGAITPLTSTGTNRIRSWKFASDNDNLYFYLVLRKNKMRTAYNLTIAFNWDESGSYTGDNLGGAESILVFQPFTNAEAGQPSCVNGSISTATVNGVPTDVTIRAYGYNPNPSASGDSESYELEFSIPRSQVPNLPAAGTDITIGAGYEWFNTSYQSVTL